MAEQGRRAQKRQETRQRLTRAAQRLFATQGFDRTTVDEIAETAGVSRRTFFHHFASKEDVVLSRHEDFERALVDAIRTCPSDVPLRAVAEQAMVAALQQFDAEEAQLLEEIKLKTPALREREQGKYERLERALAGALAERSGAAADELRVRLDAMLIAGVLRVGSVKWADALSSGVPIRDYVRGLLDTLGSAAGAQGAVPPSSSRPLADATAVPRATARRAR
jgi:AcrR family transcriptional regulator